MKMRIGILAAIAATAAVAEQQVLDNEELRLISTGPDQQEWVPSSEIPNLIKGDVKFIDITDYHEYYEELAKSVQQLETPVYPSEVNYKDEVEELNTRLDQRTIQNNLRKLTSFFTRYYKSPTGRDSSQWIASKVEEYSESYDYISVRLVDHDFAQQSIIATIEGTVSPEDIVIVAAHCDSVNGANVTDRSPGADDDGSGTVTNLEAFRVLVQSGYRPENTVEFHWYAGEEGGLLGSQQVFANYSQESVKVKAMLQQDMTGYVTQTIESGNPENIGVVTDFVDPKLTKYVELLIKEYTELPYAEFQCGYACSDHASANRVGYPSAFLIESGTKNNAGHHHVHTFEDVWQYLSYYHMEQHARASVAFAYELGFHNFN